MRGEILSTTFGLKIAPTWRQTTAPLSSHTYMVAVRQISMLGCVTLLAACSADQGRYPSLATRDVELRENTFNVPPANEQSTPVAPSPELAGRLAQLSSQMQQSHAQFLEVLPGARSAVNRAIGSPKGSPAWADAMVRLSQLDAARTQGMAILAELDDMRVDAAIQGGAREAIEDVWIKADATQSEENTVLQSLVGRLPQ